MFVSKHLRSLSSKASICSPPCIRQPGHWAERGGKQGEQWGPPAPQSSLQSSGSAEGTQAGCSIPCTAIAPGSPHRSHRRWPRHKLPVSLEFTHWNCSSKADPALGLGGGRTGTKSLSRAAQHPSSRLGHRDSGAAAAALLTDTRLSGTALPARGWYRVRLTGLEPCPIPSAPLRHPRDSEDARTRVGTLLALPS